MSRTVCKHGLIIDEDRGGGECQECALENASKTLPDWCKVIMYEVYKASFDQERAERNRLAKALVGVVNSTVPETDAGAIARTALYGDVSKWPSSR